MIPIGMIAQNAVNTVRQANIEITKVKSLWFNTSNSAGLSIIPLDNFSLINLGFQNTNGDFKMSQSGKNSNVIGFGTDGALHIGRTYLYGAFDYKNETSKNSTYITNIYDPFRDMPYYVADSISSKWKKQQYVLSAKVAFPQLWNFITPGCELSYITKTGSKQNDPRATTFYTTLDVKPAFTFKLNTKNHIGISGYYQYLYERSSTALSDDQNYKKVYIMRGLGNYSIGSVGGIGGISPFYYKGNIAGGGVQYGYSSDRFNAVLDATYRYKVEDAYQAPTKAQRMGSTKQNLYYGSLQLSLESDSYLNKIQLRYFDKSTDGIEYVQYLDKSYDVSKWITIAKYVRSNYTYKEASFNYYIFNKSDNGYRWRAGLDAIYTDRFDEYYIPSASLKAENLLFNIYGKYNFRLCKKSSLLTGVNAGYNSNIKGEYNYTGAYTDSPTVKYMFKNDIQFLASDYYKIGGEINFSTLVTKKTSLFLEASCQYYKPKDSDFSDRILTNFSIGITF